MPSIFCQKKPKIDRAVKKKFILYYSSMLTFIKIILINSPNKKVE